MILVTRLNGPPFAVNPDLLERVESTPDTVLTLIDGTKFLVAESVADVIALVRDYRASVVASARDLATWPGEDDHVAPATPLHGAGRGHTAHSGHPTHSHEAHPHLAAVPTPHQEV